MPPATRAFSHIGIIQISEHQQQYQQQQQQQCIQTNEQQEHIAYKMLDSVLPDAPPPRLRQAQDITGTGAEQRHSDR